LGQPTIKKLAARRGVPRELSIVRHGFSLEQG
jgi:hypothetical protein